MSGPAPAAAEASAGVRVWTILDLLKWTTDHFASRGIETARLDAECLLAHVLGVERLRLYIDFDKPVEESERARFRGLVKRRGGERIPVAHLLGEKEFWSLTLRVTPDVLVPRPDTETLVSAALEFLPEGKALRVLDVGTGSGAVALALGQERPEVVITATDIRQEALKIAQENAERHGMTDRIRFLHGETLAPVAGERFDLIVSNPPYLAERERAGLAPELAHEPDHALFAGADGLEVLRPLVAGARDRLEPGGAIAFELAPSQADAATGLCAEAGLEQIGLRRDLAGRSRVVTARRPG